jgi:hypothetical protein
MSADALQMELTRLLWLAADAHAAHDLALAKQATDEAAKCLMKLEEAQNALGDTQADTDKGHTDR